MLTFAAIAGVQRRVGPPEIFNTDQGSQFTSPRFTGVLQAAGVRISMDGRGRRMDNLFIERLCRSLKYECVYLHAFETGSELRAGPTTWIAYYNANRPHSGLSGQGLAIASRLGTNVRLRGVALARGRAAQQATRINEGGFGCTVALFS